MSDPAASGTARHQVLADPSGRRRRRLAVAGRAATGLLGLWLVALTLGGLGLQPLAGLPVVGALGTGEAAPPVLPARVEHAVREGTAVAAAPRRAPAPAAAAATITVAPRATARPPVRTTPAPPRPAATTTPARRPVTPPPAATPVVPATPAAPAATPAATAPGRTQTPPGQAKTTPGAPTTTPGGTTPPAKGGQGKATGKPVTP